MRKEAKMYSYESDIYSFGMIIYFLYERNNLYSLNGAGNYIKKVNVIQKMTQF